MLVRPSAAVLVAYLLATAPLVAAGAAGSPGGGLEAAAHLAALLVMIGASRWEGRGWWRAALDWAPLVLIPWMYAELPLLMQGAGATYHDRLVQGWEAVVFGTSPAATMAAAFPVAWISEPLHLAYLSYYALIYVPPVVLYAAGRRREFQEMTFAVLLTFATCFAVFALFPVQGPRYLWEADAVPRGPVRSLVTALLSAASSRGAAFPSSHVAVAVVQSMLCLRVGWRGGWVVSLLTVLLAAGAVYGGFHYAVDALAGAALGLALAGAALALFPRLHGVATPRAEWTAIGRGGILRG